MAAVAEQVSTEDFGAFEWAYADPVCNLSLHVPSYFVGRMHRLIGDELVAVERGHTRLLLIETPPQHGKTLLAAIGFSGWYLGRHPERNLQFGTYSGERAGDVGRSVRNMMALPTYRRVFPGCRVASDSSAANKFHTTAGGLWLGTGCDGGATGYPADVWVIDDPIKNRVEADSPTTLKRRIDWLSAVVVTRMSKNAPIVLIMTRWSEQDPAGWMLENMGEGIRRVRLPALAEDNDPLGRAKGEPLEPELHPLDDLMRKKAVMLPRDWDAMMQQRPSRPEGGQFPRDKVRYYKKLPALSYMYAGGDFAVTDPDDETVNQRPDAIDWTELAIVGVDMRGDFYVSDWWSGQTTSDVWTEQLVSLFITHKIKRFWSEGGVIRRMAEPYLKTEMRERKAQGVKLTWLPRVSEKHINAIPLEAMWNAGRVYWPHPSLKKPWAERAIDQICRYPGATHDDCLDALALLARGVYEMTRPREQQREAPGIRPYTMEWLRYGDRKERAGIL